MTCSGYRIAIFLTVGNFGVGTNFSQAGQTFAANMAFDFTLEGVRGLQKARFLGGGFWAAHARTAAFGRRAAGTEVYTVVNNLYGNVFMGQHKGPGPSTSQNVGKIIIHGVRILKKP